MNECKPLKEGGGGVGGEGSVGSQGQESGSGGGGGGGGSGGEGQGRAAQVDPIKPKLKPPGTKRLNLHYDAPLSSFA